MKKPEHLRSRRVKTPTVIQMEAVECGAAALAIVMGYYGYHIALEELRITCNVNRDGVKASNIVRAARTYGLESKGYRKSIERLLEMPLPVIIHWNFNHFVVLEGYDNNTVYLNDPGFGPRRVTWDEFDIAYTGIAMEFAPTESFQKGRSKPTLRQLLRRRLAGSGWALIFILTASLLLLVPGILQPGFSQFFVDDILKQDRNSLPALVAGMLLMGLVTVVLTWLQMRYLLRLETKFALKTSAEYLWHVLRLPMGFFTQRFAGDIGARVALNDEVAILLSRDLAITLISLLLIGVYGVVMAQYNVFLTAITVAIALINLVAMQIISRRRKDANIRFLQEQGKLTGMVMAGLVNIESLKARGSESILFSHVTGYHAKSINAEQQFKFLSQILVSIPTSLTMLAGTVVITFGSLLVMADHLTVGMLVAFYGLMSAFLLPITNLVELGSKLQRVEGQLNRLEDVLNYPEDGVLSSEALPMERGQSRLHGELELRDVTFGYNRLGKPLIENFSLRLQPGDRVALVGASGSGKSTVAKLIAGLYEPWSGKILFDGKPREDIPRSVLTNSLGMVDQDILLFEGTVRENLTLWDDTINQSVVVAAARDAQIHSTISQRSGAYDSQVEENGRNFSGGQRQRLEIARALVTNPSILVLDEATSALDPVTEQDIDQNLRRRGCTTVIVAHRLSTIRDADEIIVLHDGQVVQRGTHDELYRTKGVYRALISAEDYEADDNPMQNIYARLGDIDQDEVFDEDF